MVRHEVSQVKSGDHVRPSRTHKVFGFYQSKMGDHWKIMRDMI